MEHAGELYADILLPIARGTFSYRLGEAVRESVAPGMCVEVALGPRKIYAGIVWRIYGERPPHGRIRSVDSFAEGAPVVERAQMRLWEWMADYYMCELGEVMRAALPSALKPQGFSEQQMRESAFRPRTVRYAALGPAVKDGEALNGAFEKLRRRAPKQYAALVELCALAGDGDVFGVSTPAASLDSGPQALSQLAKKEIIAFEERELPPGELPPLPPNLPPLSDAQRVAAESLRTQLKEKQTALLHGVTGSGKTEIYMHLIKEVLEQGRNVLYLVPEIAMSGQLVERIRKWFGERTVVHHSGLNPRRRVENYLRASRSSGGELLLGTRSALFLPPGDLGLIVVDEEHDPGYKNADTAPRYNARDAAAVLARITGAALVLGSATPALESYRNALTGKYGYVTLDRRYSGAGMPVVTLSDTMRSVKRGERKSHFNPELLIETEKTLAAGGQIMLFQNRRGFAPYVECGACGWTARCGSCNVTLTLHKGAGELVCHYCGHREPVPVRCPACGGPPAEPRGFGTEKAAEEIQAIFPKARVGRLDRDTAGRAAETVSAFERGETDILVGTQMITKGFDFAGVELVGILNADNLLSYPDFRASERAFQTIMQIAGRAGRREVQGRVVVQTSQPDNEVIKSAVRGDYPGMAAALLAERETFFYPPFSQMVTIIFRHSELPLLERAAELFAARARTHFGRRLTGPQPPPVDRVRGEWIRTAILRVERSRSFAEAKRILAAIRDEVRKEKECRSVDIVFDVDPQ